MLTLFFWCLRLTNNPPAGDLMRQLVKSTACLNKKIVCQVQVWNNRYLRDYTWVVSLLYFIPQAWRILPKHSLFPCWHVKLHPPSGLALNCKTKFLFKIIYTSLWLENLHTLALPNGMSLRSTNVERALHWGLNWFTKKLRLSGQRDS